MSAPAARPGLLVVDDDELILELLVEELGVDHDVIGVRSRPEVAQALRQLGAPPAHALVDLGLPPHPDSPREGLALIRELRALAPECAVIVISGQSKEEHAKIARALGAIDYVAKPCDAQQIREALGRASAAQQAAAKLGGLLGASEQLGRLREQIAHFAQAPHPVLIEGESGTGKELVARALHRGSGVKGEFVALNCAAMPAQLFEAALFGARRGSYTGAVADTAGHLATAENGSLFLDEISDLPLELQPKLLRVMECGEYFRVGDTKLSIASTRLIAATNSALRDGIAAGRFREDLYHRLSVLMIQTPPLRELGDDRLVLLEKFSAAAAASANAAAFALDDAARELWCAYEFPGNVRELRNIVLRLQVLYPGQTVERAQLQKELLHDATATAAPAAGTLDALLQRDASAHARKALAECGSEAGAARRLGISLQRLDQLLERR